jgi:hypothetical protein
MRCLALLAALLSCASAEYARVLVLGFTSEVLGDHLVEVPAAGLPAEAAMLQLVEAGLLTWRKQDLGGVHIVSELQGEASHIPTTGWILSHTHNGETKENVGMKQVLVQDKDELTWRLQAMSMKKAKSTPKPAPTVEAPPDSGEDEF